MKQNGWQGWLPAAGFLSLLVGLAMTAATVSATAVEPATSAAVESAATVESTTAAEVRAAAATESASSAAGKAAASCKATASVEAATEATASEPATTVKAASESAAAEEVAATEAPSTEPGAGTDEDATDEVVRAVVAVRGASVRVISVITVIANRRWAVIAATVIATTDADPDGKLCIGVGRGQKHECKANANKSKIFEITHFVASRRERYLIRCGPLVPGLPFLIPLGVPTPIKTTFGTKVARVEEIVCLGAAK
jgi:hypothetical protein